MQKMPNGPAVPSFSPVEFRAEVDKIRAIQIAEQQQRQQAFRDRLVELDAERAAMQAERVALLTQPGPSEGDKIVALELRLAALEHAVALIHQEVPS